MTSWQRFTIKGVVHICPIQDIRQHFSEDCWCEAAVEEGLIIHNSADQREAYEQRLRKPH